MGAAHGNVPGDRDTSDVDDEHTHPSGRPWRRPMRARAVAEAHRSATPLELLFDLCFVVAVALAADQLHHAVSEDHIADGVVSYLMVFFAIWWAWMNVTWFASAYDVDDGPYRLATAVQIAGVLVLAAGVPRAFAGDFTVVTIGYTIMRLALVGQWLRAAYANPAGRRTALRFAAGVTACQIGWLTLLVLPQPWRLPLFPVLVLAELAVPLWAEHAGRTPWHPQHIAERYGLFTLIVLGETVLAATTAIQIAVDAGGASAGLLSIAASGLVIVFSLWWVYFDRPVHHLLVSNRIGFFWGYGHYFVFSSAAAVGAGIAVTVDHETGKSHLPEAAVGGAVAVPVAVYLLVVWLLHIRPHRDGRTVKAVAFPTAAALVLATVFTPHAVVWTALVVAALVAVGAIAAARHAARPGVS